MDGWFVGHRYAAPSVMLSGLLQIDRRYATKPLII
jgi:hypothetical protein